MYCTMYDMLNLLYYAKATWRGVGRGQKLACDMWKGICDAKIEERKTFLMVQCS